MFTEKLKYFFTGKRWRNRKLQKANRRTRGRINESPKAHSPKREGGRRSGISEIRIRENFNKSQEHHL